MAIEQLTIYTIGHSNQSLESFKQLLVDNSINALVDVRSVPHSKFASQFNSSALENSITEIGIKYIYLGRELGGRPNYPTFYDADGYVLYYLIAQSSQFQRSVTNLIERAKKFKIAIMCSEEDPTECHRHLLIGRVLADGGIQVLHIRADGRVQSEENIAYSFQLNLFAPEKEKTWRSVKPIRLDSQNTQQNNSLE